MSPLFKRDKYLRLKDYVFSFLYWLFFGILTGALCGFLGALFAKSVSFVTELRAENKWLLFLLPIGGLVSVALYKLCKATDIGTNRVLESIRTEKTVPISLLPAIFIGSVITHLFGGSAGREGAALQLGGSVSALVTKIFKLNEKSRHILTMCGMGALFSAIFGTPLGACVFALEVVRVGQICSAALFPSLVSSVTAFVIADKMGVNAERFDLKTVPDLSFGVLWRMAIIIAVVAIVSMLFCHVLHTSEKVFNKVFKNPFIRIFIGGVMIVLLTLFVDTNDYNGGGIDVVERIFVEGTVKPEAFFLKILFTAITIGCGFKGGEIVPSFFIGATLGGSLAGLVGFAPAFGAAIGMVSVFSGVTNCPLAAVFLCAEMFGTEGILLFGIASIVSFFLSGNISLYSEQRLLFSKLREEFTD